MSAASRDGRGESTARTSSDNPYDLIVVGAGSAGFAAAIKGAELGGRVAMIEGGTLGGTCVNVGCVPSKTLIRAAEARHRRTHHGFDGIPATDGAVDWARVRGAKDDLVSQLRQGKYWNVLSAYDGISLIEDRATIGSDGSVILSNGTAVPGGKIVITTGSSPWTARHPGLAEAGYLDSTSAMALEELPETLIVLGGSLVALELGQMFSRLGVAVTIVARGSLLSREHPAIGEALAGYLGAEGLTVLTHTRVERVVRDGRYRIAVSIDGRADALEADQLLVATGRRANTRRLGLENASVTVGKAGELVVNEYLQTTNPDIYGAGDVTGDPMYVYVAAYAGTLAAENALTGNTRVTDLRTVPRVTFTDPAVAAVGLTEDDARTQGLDPITGTLPLEHLPRALAARDTRGFVHLVADAKTRRLIGAHILAPEAGEMITEPTLAIKFGLTIEDLTGTFHPYLTLSEGIKLAAQTFDKDVDKLSCCAA